MTTPVAIVGGAAVTPLGDDLEATWAALERGATAVVPWRRGGAEEGAAPSTAPRPGDEGRWGETPEERLLGPHGVWLARAAEAAHAVAGGSAWPRAEVGLYAAFGPVDPAPEHLAECVAASRDADGRLDLARFFRDGRDRIHPLWMLSMLPNVSAGVVAERLQTKGDFAVLASGADAGAEALIEAQRAIAEGVVRAAIVGAAAEPLSEASLARREAAGTLACGPARGARWFVPGEGAAALALEAASSAAARGTAVLGWLTGHAVVGGGRDGAPLGAAADLALERAGRTWADVDLLFGGTPFPPDATRVALGGGEQGLLGRWGRACPAGRLVSAQRGLGHLGAAAALLDVLLALRSFAAGAGPRGCSLGLDVAGAAPPAPPPPQRALVLAPSSEGGCSALLLEAAACVS